MPLNTPNSDRIGVALAISETHPFDQAANWQQLIHWTDVARQEGARIICFPEMQLTGYELSADLQSRAQTLPGKIVERLLHLASKTHLTILTGLAEIDNDGRIYATHLVIHPSGHWFAYRKLHLAPPEHAWLSAGNQIPTFEARWGKFGIQLCYDAHFPDLSTHMALAGAEVIFVPHASPHGSASEKEASWFRHLSARAYDNTLYVLAVNPCGQNRNGIPFPGVAMAIDSAGYQIASLQTSQPKLLFVELDLAALRQRREHPMRYFLPNYRSDLASLPSPILRVDN